MNALEHHLTYPLGKTLPEPGRTLEVAPGVHWVRMALPFALDHINLWLLRDRIDGVEGWTLVDCGIDNAPTRDAWEGVFAQALGGLPVLRVVVTHMHPDHIGLAHWLTERWSCRLWISETDYHGACLGSSSSTGVGGDAAAAFMASHGLTDAGSLDKSRQRSSDYASMVPKVPPQFRRLLDGGVLHIGGHDWRCIAGYGHAPEHMALWCETRNLLISGDMVLPTISTNVAVHESEPEGDALALYLASLARYRPLPADALVLPSHGRPFVGLHARLDQLRAHHHDRLAEVLAACTEAPQTAASLLPVMFRRPLDPHQTTFAMAESIAHLNLLWHDGRLRRTLGSDGVHRFTPA